MTANLRILNLEDSPNDLELMRRILQSEWPGCEVVPVSDRDEFASRLLQGGFDVVLSDNTLPGFDGVSALKLAREVAPDVPFIFVSGTIGEEFAIESLRNGATDYVLKHHMNALVPAVKRALREAEERARRHQAETTLRRREQYFRALTENLLDIVTILSADGRFRYNSPSAERVLGFTPGELADRIAFELIHPDDVAAARSTLADCVQHPGRVVQLEFRFRHKDGSYRYLESVGRSLLDHPEIAGVVVNSRDITDR
ncbi:MAG TPA: PAS domain S-box protein, partial [Verrucomicrobiae bacterium]